MDWILRYCLRLKNVRQDHNLCIEKEGFKAVHEYLVNGGKIDIEDHINTELYEEALAEATKSYGDEAPDFYEAQQKFFDENDK